MVAPEIMLPFRYHWLPVALLEVKVLPEREMVGVGGVALRVTEVGAEVAEQPPAEAVTV